MTKKAAAKTPDIPNEAEAQEFSPEQGELFAAELANWPVKDDMASMEFSLFSLSKKKDLTTKEYRRGNRSVRIIPSSVGAATQFDKDLLLYVSSQIVEARKQNLPVSRTIKVNSVDFLTGTSRSTGGASYDRIIDMLRRLRGTTIETNIPTGKDKITQTDGFSMIDSFRVLSQKNVSYKKKKGADGEIEAVDVERIFSFTITISEWLYNGLLNHEVLTLDRNYFKLTSPIQRRLYEIARKHCGGQAMWKINIELLAEKIGSAQDIWRLRDDIRMTIKNDTLPEYKVALDMNASPNFVVFYTRENALLSRELLKKKNFTWFQSLLRNENFDRMSKSSSIKDDLGLPAA
ncbi:MAG: replication initiator protein A [Candidatus Accumulibacter sp.]|jgi:plasmid replication initiation protein|nr:replication initiator protein A [Accumulibacter sp.]